MALDLLFVAAAAAVLWKTADWFVEGAVGVAERLRVPKMLIGIVLVSFATTSPELLTSVIATVRGYPELALGNAVGSIIVDVGIALGCAAALSSLPMLADRHVFGPSAVFVLLAISAGFALTMDGVMTRGDGLALMAMYAGYLLYSYRQVKRHREAARAAMEGMEELERQLAGMGAAKILRLFVGGFLGVLLGSELLVTGATGLAEELGLSPVIIGLTVTAVGTSVPEIATCAAAALKRQSQVGVGNIVGADILNICWVAGASSLFNPLGAEKQVVWYMFPCALAMVGAMLLMIGLGGFRVRRWNGFVLMAMYAAYAAGLYFIAGPAAAR